MRTLLAALNRSGWVRTVFSCAGHPEEPDAVARGRRQAHVDVLVADGARWRAFVRRLRAGAPDGVRVVAGSLGPPPRWLRRALRGEPVPPDDRAGPPWWQQLLPDALTAAPDGRGRRWRYRRLVLEPVPYDLPPEACRRVLDGALGAAVAALQGAPGGQGQPGGPSGWGPAPGPPAR